LASAGAGSSACGGSAAPAKDAAIEGDAAGPNADAGTDAAASSNADAAGSSNADATGPNADAAVDAEGTGDAIPGDSAVDDSGQDAGPPDAGNVFHSSSCLSCESGCPGGLCVTAQTTNETYCADRCDADLNGCLAGFACVDIGPLGRPTLVCLPPGGSCRDFGVGFGTPCEGGTEWCQYDRQLCQGDILGQGYCTDPCAFVPCPAGYTCGTGSTPNLEVCLASFGGEWERCGEEGQPGELLCGDDTACATMSGALCVIDPQGTAGVCAAPCDAMDACPDGHTCRMSMRGKVCLPDRCSCRASHLALAAAPGTRDLLAEALAAVGLDRCTMGLRIQDWVQNPPEIIGDPYRLSFTNPLLSEPWRVPIFARETVRALDQPAQDAQRGPAYRAARLVEALATDLDRPAVHLPPGAIDMSTPLVSAVSAFISAAGGVPDPMSLAASATAVPMDLQLAMATVVDGARRALLARNTAFASLAPGVVQQIYDLGPPLLLRSASNMVLDITSAQVATMLNQQIVYGSLYGGAADLMDAIDQADLARFAVNATVAGTTTTAPAHLLFSVMTPAGRIAIGDGRGGLYDPRNPGFEGDWAILLDLGGDDIYRIPAGGNSSAANPVAVLIDLSGNDQYGYVEVPNPLDGARLVSDADGRGAPIPMQAGPQSLSNTPRQGGGRAGIGVLVDLGGGADIYRSLRMSQGAGLFGAGILVDDGGDDSYDAEAMAQGAAMFGVGLLLDLAGRDLHHAYQAAQGFGFARGAGLLYDLAGADDYLMDNGDPMYGGDPLYPSAQRPASSNASLGQGFGFGRRASGTNGDNAYMSGGLGILVDAAGDDRYSASIFGLGGGYWYGTGILADESGADSYDGMWYAMGAAAHFALGILLDGAGDDTYGGRLPRLNVTIGGGHDFSTAVLIDESGDDHYYGSRITLGAGNATGNGFFADNGGNDTYTASSAYSMGAAGLLDASLNAPGSPRLKTRFLGVFMDAGGMDRYTVNGMPPVNAIGDDRTWLGSQSMAAEIKATERGAGIDGSGDTTFHAVWP
jgi:hypothetical protein